MNLYEVWTLDNCLHVVAESITDAEVRAERFIMQARSEDTVYKRDNHIRAIKLVCESGWLVLP